jgi:glycosyltransferase involved in cell wall biosynthesis
VKNNLDVLYVYQYFGTPKGGWSTRVYEMCRRWVNKGNRVRVITSRYDKTDLKSKWVYSREFIEGIEVYTINVLLSNKHGFFRRIYTFLIFSLVATFLAVSINADIIIASSGPITVGIPGLIAKWIKKKPLVFEVRDLWPDGAVAFGVIKNSILIRISYWFEALCYRNSELVVACSSGIKASILNRFPGLSVINIPNASDVELFRNEKISDDVKLNFKGVKIFVYTGTIGLIDNCCQILMAAEELQKRGRVDIHIFIIGDGQEKHSLELRAKEMALENLTFLGLMPKKDLVVYLRNARASILTVKPIPFMDNCSPNKVFDAFAAGIPILQTTQGWIKELVNKERCGINLPPNDPFRFADAIEILTDDDDLFQELSRNSSRLGDYKFNRDYLSEKMLLSLKEIVWR